MMAIRVRMTISVPPHLKDRMDAVDVDVNWSAVACRAFEIELGEIAKRKGAEDMKDVIQRLRASRVELEQEDKKEGYEAGQEWAKTRAEVRDFKRLETLHLDLDRNLDLFFAEGNAYSPAERFFFVIATQYDGDRVSARDFWETIAGDQCDEKMGDDEFIRGFMEAALDVWYEVKDAI